MKRFEHASPTTNAEIEFRSVGDQWQFTGYAALFDKESDPRLGFIETVAPSAFNRSLASKTHSFVVDHQESLILATEKSARLRLSVDSRGLLTESKLPDTTYARDLKALHEAGETSGMSFTFKPTRGGVVAGQHQSGLQTRRLIDVSLGHVTILTSANEPAYPATATEFAFRALAEALKAEPDDLDALFDAITEQRELTPVESSLLARLAAHYGPPAPEPETVIPEAPANEEPVEGRTLAEWTALLAEKGIVTPK
jgi:HK97 family phage prohead protease